MSHIIKETLSAPWNKLKNMLFPQELLLSDKNNRIFLFYLCFADIFTLSLFISIFVLYFPHLEDYCYTHPSYIAYAFSISRWTLLCSFFYIFISLTQTFFIKTLFLITFRKKGLVDSLCWLIIFGAISAGIIFMITLQIIPMGSNIFGFSCISTTLDGPTINTIN
jgi:hypothetical protein